MILLPTIYLLISLILGLGLIIISHKVLSGVMKKKFGLGPDSLTFNVMASGLMVSLAMLMAEAARPMISLINLLSQGSESGWILTSVMYILGFYISIIVMAMSIIFGSVFFFHKMTGNLDEEAELKKQNLGVAILLTTVILSMTIFLKSPLVSVFESIIPYPSFSY
jgi:hypothetical protein